MGPIRRRDATAALVAIALFAGGLVASAAFDGLRGLSLDTLTALRWRLIGNAHAPSASPTVVVALDRDSYRTPPFKGAPTITWTREIGRVVTALIDGGAKVVGFDVVFPTSIEESTLRSMTRPSGRGCAGSIATSCARSPSPRAPANWCSAKCNTARIRHALAGPARCGRPATNIRSLNVYGEFGRRRAAHAADCWRRRRRRASISLELAARALGAAPQLDADQSVTLAGYRIPAATPNAMTLNFDGGADDIPTYSFADLSLPGQRRRRIFPSQFRRQGRASRFELGFEDGKLTTKRFATAPALPPADVARCRRRRRARGLPASRSTASMSMRRRSTTSSGATPSSSLLRSPDGVFHRRRRRGGRGSADAGAVARLPVAALRLDRGRDAAFADALALPLLEPLPPR